MNETGSHRRDFLWNLDTESREVASPRQLRVGISFSFQNHIGNRLLLGMAQREMTALAAESRGELRRLAMKLQNWTLPRQANDLDILPGYAVAQPGTDGLHSGFLGGKAGRQTLCGVGFAHAIPDLGGGRE